MSKLGLTLLPSQEAAAELGISQRRMQQLLASGRVIGAQRVGRSWIVPSPIKLKPGKRGPIGVAGRGDDLGPAQGQEGQGQGEG